MAAVWGVEQPEAKRAAEELVLIGFFEPRLSDFWVPFMYRPALEMVQGSAEGVAATDEE